MDPYLTFSLRSGASGCARRRTLMILCCSIVIPIVICGTESGGLKSGAKVNSRGVNDVIEPPRSHAMHSALFDEDYYSDYDDEFLTSQSQEEIREHEDPGPKEIAKCCSPGEALNAEGGCYKYPASYSVFDKNWYPERYLDPNISPAELVPFNISAWNITSPFEKICHQPRQLEIVADLDNFILLGNGELFVSHHNRAIERLQFCYDQQIGKDARRVIKACFMKEELGAEVQALRKCCLHNTMLELHSGGFNGTCVLPSPEEAREIPWNSTVRHELPVCEYGHTISEIRSGDTFDVAKDGTFIVNNEVSVPFLSYCIDYIKENGQEPKLKYLQCLSHTESFNAYAFDIVLGVLQIISAVCLALAAVILTKLPELRTLHGKCQLSFLGTLFFLFVLMATARLTDDKLPPSMCTFVAVAIHCCALSSFFWLSLLCVNIYCRLRSIRPPLAPSRAENCRLVIICISGWGLPAAFCLFLYALDGTPKMHDDWAPQYGFLKCWISNKTAEVWYILVPVGILLLGNGMLFCLTAKELLCGIWRMENSDSFNFRSKSMGMVVAKLAILMGIGWILDVTSLAIGPEYKHYFYGADVYNALQGVFIFLAIVWRKRVLEVLRIRKPSVTRDDTLTGRPFLNHKHTLSQTMTLTLTNGDQDVSLISAQDT